MSLPQQPGCFARIAHSYPGNGGMLGGAVGNVGTETGGPAGVLGTAGGTGGGMAGGAVALGGVPWMPPA